jgi:hypothetical protein
MYFAGNFVPVTTAAPVVVATGTAIKTLMQVGTPATKSILVLEWGISFDGSAAATPGKIELIDTDVAATSGTSVTPTKWGNPNGEPSLCVGGTGATCHSPSAEGTITAARSLDVQLLPPTQPFFKQFPLGREPEIAISRFLRIRVTFAATVNAYCYIVWEE